MDNDGACLRIAYPIGSHNIYYVKYCVLSRVSNGHPSNQLRMIKRDFVQAPESHALSFRFQCVAKMALDRKMLCAPARYYFPLCVLVC